MGRGTVREERGKPVTEVTFKPQGRSPGLNSLTPSTSPPVFTVTTYTHIREAKKLRRLISQKRGVREGGDVHTMKAMGKHLI